MSVRLALGGSRSRLVRQLLVEGGVLAGVGGLLGIALAYLGVPALLSLAPDDFPRLEAVQLDWSVVAFALAATGGCALLFALVPALRSTKADLTDTLGQRSVSGDPRSQRLSRALVVAEVAVSLVLVTSTGLLLKSMAGLSAVDLGFEPSGLVTFSLEAPEWGDTDEEAAATIVAFSERFASVPGVRSVGFTNRLPLGGGLYTGYMRSAEMVAADASPLAAAVRFVTPGYLDAMGGRLVAGRWLRTDDGTQHVVVDELIAERFWPGRNPVGQTLETNAVGQNAAVAEVVGVVEPMKHHGVAESATETVFFSMLAQARQHNFRYVAARVQGSPVASVDGLRAAARQVDSNAVVSRVRTMDDLFADDVATTRFSALLLALFGGIALLLASVGLHGVMAYSMRRRTREIGIRVVLGARHGEIVGDAVRSGGWLVLAGVAIGLVTSLGAARLLESLLFEVSPLEPSVLLGGAAVMGAFGLLGAYLPARLALSVDPAVTLREE